MWNDNYISAVPDSGIEEVVTKLLRKEKTSSKEIEEIVELLRLALIHLEQKQLDAASAILETFILKIENKVCFGELPPEEGLYLINSTIILMSMKDKSSPRRRRNGKVLSKTPRHPA